LTDLWQIKIIGTKSQLEEIEAGLETYIIAPLSLSLFEDTLPAWRLEIVVDQEPDNGFISGLGAGVAVEIIKLPVKNWVLESLRFLTPVLAGRFYIHGSHDQPKITDDAISICIPAGLAFGTGHHETTKGCLLEFDQILGEGAKFQQILDLGTGAGILAIAAAKAQNAPVLATDIDGEAVDVAKANIVENQVGTQIDLLVADGVNHPALQDTQFDLIFANILAGPLIEMAASLVPLLAKNGQLILAGLLHEQAQAVGTAYADQGLKMVRSRELGDWTILRYQA